MLRSLLQGCRIKGKGSETKALKEGQQIKWVFCVCFSISSVVQSAETNVPTQMIGLAFDIQDSRSLHTVDQSRGDTESDDQREERRLLIKHTAINPSVKDIVCFSFCYIGALTGRPEILE